ncbi:MAG: type II toxin-antitoxin system RelE/ParE family toxin [Bryobacteraceae bacterium]|jgi:plasmid stabilization system protein ParE
MIADDFHPEALLDLDEIWEFIRGDSLDEAGRLIAEILDAIGDLVPFPGRGHRRPDITSRPVGCRGDARTAQPPRDGRNSHRQRVDDYAGAGRNDLARRIFHSTSGGFVAGTVPLITDILPLPWDGRPVHARPGS